MAVEEELADVVSDAEPLADAEDDRVAVRVAVRVDEPLLDPEAEGVEEPDPLEDEVLEELWVTDLVKVLVGDEDRVDEAEGVADCDEVELSAELAEALL